MLYSLALWVGLPQQLQEGRIGAVKCIALALEEKCDLVGAANRG